MLHFSLLFLVLSSLEYFTELHIRLFLKWLTFPIITLNKKVYIKYFAPNSVYVKCWLNNKIDVLNVKWK